MPERTTSPLLRRTTFGLCVAVLASGSARALAAERDAAPPPKIPSAAARPIDFAKDVYPLFAKHCLDCHGPDLQEGRLRLDARVIVAKGGVSGPLFVVGTNAAAAGERSLLLKRLVGLGGEKRMPLDADPLTDAEIGVLRAWIEQGAKWPDGVGSPATELDRHWAYEKPVRPPLPSPRRTDWGINEVDRFVLAKLEAAKVAPSKAASKETLIRRATLDLIGLPPTLAEIDAFLADDRDGAYERVVDRLLASPRYGERWAVPWLDAARFADSNGYQRDGRRELWAYRDWVIDAFNADMPFDRFTIEQLAGDLLPNPTRAQRVATGFHRGTMANVEAGTDPEEQHVLALIDRVNTTGTVWLGTTIECAQCHNHKYDPFSQRDFYRLYAFFNNTEKEIRTSGSNREFVGPLMELPLTDEQQAERERLRSELATLERTVQAHVERMRPELATWERQLAESRTSSAWRTLDPERFEAVETTELAKLDDRSILAKGDGNFEETYRVDAKSPLKKITGFRLEVLPDPSLPRGGPGRGENGDFRLTEFKVEVAAASQPERFTPVPIASATADHSANGFGVALAIDGKAVTGWSIAPRTGRGHHATFVPKKPLELGEGDVLRFTLDQRNDDGPQAIGRFQLLVTDQDPQRPELPPAVRVALETPIADRTPAQWTSLAEQFAARNPKHSAAVELAKFDVRRLALTDGIAAIQPPSTLVMRELDQPRATNVFERGDFLKPLDEVQPGTPRILPPLAVEPGRRPTRLDLARWLVSPENPLTARVTVNRQWAEFFGRGLVESLEDFGTQADRPSHPELLDWLAVEFVERGWRLKSLHRLIVTSAAYRQSSRIAPAMLKRDPYNRLYARGPRLRLPAEFVRDNALAIAGLLSDRQHGPPVFPHQPPGVWNHTGRASNVWETSRDENLYRRGLYTYWRRTVPYPSFVAFDAPSREACTVQRSRSNTPLQALTLLNDAVYFEAATALAGRMLKEAESATPEQRAAFGFRLATARRPTADEGAILVARFEAERDRLKSDAAALAKFLKRWPAPSGVDPVDFAAWTHVANVLLNLDETITKG